MFTFTNGGRSYVLGGMYWLVNFKVPARYLKNRLGFINQLLLLRKQNPMEKTFYTFQANDIFNSNTRLICKGHPYLEFSPVLLIKGIILHICMYKRFFLSQGSEKKIVSKNDLPNEG